MIDAGVKTDDPKGGGVNRVAIALSNPRAQF